MILKCSQVDLEMHPKFSKTFNPLTNPKYITKTNPMPITNLNHISKPNPHMSGISKLI